MAPTKAAVNTLESACTEFTMTANGWKKMLDADLIDFNSLLTKEQSDTTEAHANGCHGAHVVHLHMVEREVSRSHPFHRRMPVSVQARLDLDSSTKREILQGGRS
jgi:hypothetical protein